MQEIYSAVHIRTHLNNALYQITAVCFEHELLIAESPAVFFSFSERDDCSLQEFGVAI